VDAIKQTRKLSRQQTNNPYMKHATLRENRVPASIKVNVIMSNVVTIIKVK